MRAAHSDTVIIISEIIFEIKTKILLNNCEFFLILDDQFSKFGKFPDMDHSQKKTVTKDKGDLNIF